MKIVEARVYSMEATGRHFTFVKLLTDQGVYGVGEAALAYGIGATAAAGMVKDLCSKLLIGKDPSRIEAIWSEMYDHSFWAKGGGPVIFAAMSAIEQALWDIKGKVLGVPVYELLGGKCRDEVEVYANGWSYHLSQPEKQAERALEVVDDGYTAIKLYPLAMPTGSGPESTLRHVSHRTIDRETEELAVSRVRAVREAVGPDIRISVDMSAELTTEAVIRLGRRLEEFDLEFFEEPVDPFDVESMKRVSDALAMPVAAGERLYTRYGFRRIMEMRAADILQPDPGVAGGIMETKKIAAMAEVYNMRIQPHNCASPLCTAVALQIDACIPNFYIQEMFPYRSPDHYSVVDQAPELEIRNGRLRIPDRPGLGVDLVDDRVEPHLWAQCKES